MKTVTPLMSVDVSALVYEIRSDILRISFKMITRVI